jgi:hypothetical protein
MPQKQLKSCPDPTLLFTLLNDNALNEKPLSRVFLSCKYSSKENYQQTKGSAFGRVTSKITQPFANIDYRRELNRN